MKNDAVDGVRLWRSTAIQRFRCWLRGVCLTEWRSCKLPLGGHYYCPCCGRNPFADQD